MGEFLGLSLDELQLFLDETGEHLDILELDVLELEGTGGTDPDRLARIFRAAHTIKGAAATVGLEGTARLTHTMETLFDRMRSGHLTPSLAVVTLLLQAVDVLRVTLAALREQQLPADHAHELIAALAAAAEDQAGPGAATAAAATQPAPAGAQAVQVQLSPDCPMPAVRALQVVLALEGLGTVVGSDPTQAAIEAEQVRDTLTVWVQSSSGDAALQAAVAAIPDIQWVSVAAAALPPSRAQAPGPAPAEPAAVARGNDDRTIRVDVGLLDDLMNLVGELVIDRGRLGGIGQMLAPHTGAQGAVEELSRVTEHVARVTASLQETVLKARMLPIDRVFKKFPRMVRDVAAHLGKQVEFRVAGEETELDRSLIEVIGDPLMHLLRNALDHGLESPQDRVRIGKPPGGTLALLAFHEENHVVVLVKDDGRGIDPERLRAAAVRKGLLSAERVREIGDQEAMQLLFASGFSTAEQVTDLSGRGVGLDVVRKNIERVGGRVEVDSEIGVGTTFRLQLPLTLATIRALLVEVEGGTFALPLGTVAEVLQVEPNQVSSIKGHWVTRVRGRVVPLIWLQRLMSPGLRPGRCARPVLAVLVSHKGERVGLVVESLQGEQEVVVKGLGQFFGQVRGLSGVTILGDGSLALILDVPGVINLLGADTDGALRSQAVG